MIEERMQRGLTVSVPAADHNIVAIGRSRILNLNCDLKSSVLDVPVKSKPRLCLATPHRRQRDT